MTTITTRSDIRIFENDTYGNGNPETFGLPLDQFAYLREHEPCFLQEHDSPLLRERVWVLTRHEDVWNVDKDGETWVANPGPFIFKYPFLDLDDPLGKPAMLISDGAEHGRQRRVISSGFTPKRVQQLEESFRGYARKVVDDALKVGTFNFVRQVADAMPMEALGDVLGVPAEDRPKFFGWVDMLAAPFDRRMTPSLDAALQANQALMDYAIQLRERRKDDPGDDVMSWIIRAASDEQLSDDEVMGNVGVLASGAVESTRAALSHGMHELMRRPDQMQWLRDRADNIPASAIQEIVRITTPFTHFIRTASRDVELHGQAIKRGESVAIHMAAGNFDPEVFDDPNSFDLSRDPNPHLSFGRGPHSCLGKHVAALEMKVLLEELLQRTKEIKPAGHISYVHDCTARGVYELPVTVVPS